MSKLKPGVKYIYEHADGITYAREFGSLSTDRFEIGRTEGRHDLDEHELWNEIRSASRTNPVLRKHVDRVILIYKLLKDGKNE